MTNNNSAEDFQERCRANDVHTVEIGAPDAQGHLRGKRVPVDRFFNTTVEAGVSLADAMFVFDIQNDLPDNEYVNPGTGFLDCHLVPDLSSGRILTHRPGYAFVLADAFDETGAPHPLAPRAVLANQIELCEGQGIDPLVATELEFYLCTPDWEPR